MVKPSFRFEKTIKDKEIYSFYREHAPFSKADLCTLAVIFAVILLIIIFAFPKSQGNYAEIYYKGELKATYSLSENKYVALDYDDCHAIIQISDGKIAITENNCVNKICVNSGYISKVNERIVCAPNKIVIVIRGNSKDEVDVITGGVR